MTAMKLLGTATLGVAYVAVGWAAAHPKVSDEYAAHFLHRTAECWHGRRDPKAHPTTIEIGTLTYPDACRYLRWGWYPIEGWGVWSRVRGSTLHLPARADARAVLLTFRAATALGPLVRVRFSWDDQQVEETFPPDVTRSLTVPLRPGGVDLHLLPLVGATVPGGPYPITVGIGLTEIRYEQDEDAGVGSAK